jgi:hypothetical protein
VQAILASPRFLFRIEQLPSTLKAGQTYRIGDSDLASRLSFFIWGSMPDAELLKTASLGTLRTPVVFEKQLKRLLTDSRSEALSTRFASQWLRLQDVEKVRPDHHFYSYWDTTLSQAMVRETELFVDSLIREDRPVTDLLTADHTFVNGASPSTGIRTSSAISTAASRSRTSPPRRARPGQRAAAHPIADRNFAGAARQVGDGSRLGLPPRRRPTCRCSETKAVEDGKTLRRASAWRCIARIPRATQSHRVIDPPASRSRITTSPAKHQGQRRRRRSGRRFV